MNQAEFHQLLDKLAEAWLVKDYAAAVELFVDEIQYADPLRYRLNGKAELRAFFEADDGYEQRTVWHTTIFDEERQVGAAEYTFDGTHRYHGMVIIKLRDDRISHWREYQHIDSRDWQAFASGTDF